MLSQLFNSEKSIFFHVGKFVNWQRDIYKRPENMSMYYKEIIRQMYDIGIGSLTIVVIISLFIGAVTAVQFSYQLSGGLIPDYYIGYVVRDMEIIELAATITCLVLAGKVGSNMAAEIGGMRQKEHIDAMEVMGVNTSAYIIMPKIIAAVIVIPILVSISAVVGIVGGFAASMATGALTEEAYIKGLRSFFVPYNVLMMYVKAFVFAYILTSVSCYQGYFVRGGSIELGEASTRAVVYSDILILIADFIIALVLTI